MDEIGPVLPDGVQGFPGFGGRGPFRPFAAREPRSLSFPRPAISRPWGLLGSCGRHPHNAVSIPQETWDAIGRAGGG